MWHFFFQTHGGCKQALISLLSNAIKFTAPGGPVTIGSTGHGDDVAFEVADTGIGMTSGQIDVGLGLPLADRLARLYGGVLRIKGRPGRGTVVTARLPASVSRLADEQ